MTSSILAIDNSVDLSADQDRLDEVLDGLRREPPRLSPVWFYDRRGSELFERICELPEYYLTRTELGIMDAHAADIAAALGPGVTLIEPGSGASLKTRLLLDTLHDLTAYVPVDVSREHLIDVAASLQDAYPALDIRPVCEDFTASLSIPPALLESDSRRVVYFPGSTIGNFERNEAVRLLRQMRDTAGDDGLVLLGIDRVKNVEILEKAYNDAAGVTALFNLNALRHMNRELDADFDPAGFSHRAPWVPGKSRIEMRLLPRNRQSVTISGESFSFEAPGYLLTEYSHKYTMADAEAVADAAGLSIKAAWSDEADWFSVLMLEPTHDR